MINWECLLIPVIASANHHPQGWHSTDSRQLQHPEFACTLHHLPNELETGGREDYISASDRRLEIHQLTVSLGIVRKRPSEQMGQQGAKKESASITGGLAD